MKSKCPLIGSYLLAVAALAAGCGGGGGADGTDSAPAEPSSSAAPPAVWGSLTARGAGEVARAMPLIAPNLRPTAVFDRTGALLAVFWRTDNSYDARDSIEPPAYRLASDIVVNTVAGASASAPFVGQLVFKLRVNTASPNVDTAQAVITCGSDSGPFAGLPRDAGCEGVAFDGAAQTLRLSNTPVAGADTTFSGELRYPVLTLQNGTTATSADALTQCPGAAVGVSTAVSWTDASCLAGRFVGTSDDDKSCTIDIKPDTQSVRVNIDGYEQTFGFVAQLDYSQRNLEAEPGGVEPGVARGWEYRFARQATNGARIEDMPIDQLIIGFDANTRFDGGHVGAISALVLHITAPAGTAGPVDFKSCGAVLR